MTEDPASSDAPAPSKAARGFTSRIVEIFITSKLSILFLIASLLAGAVALLLTPREEEPQIVVPVADILVSFPGATADEVEKLVSTPLESKLWEIDGVEYVYSASQPGAALITVRFYVGEDRERSLVKVWNKVMSNQDTIPPGVAGWLVKPIEIDDVPIVLLSFWSPDGTYDGEELRRIADEVLDKLQRVPNTGKAWVVGGEVRKVTVYLDPRRLAARGLTPIDVSRALRGANVNVPAGSFDRDGREILFEAGPFFQSARELEGVVVSVSAGRPIYLRDVADVSHGPEEPTSYTRIGFGPASERTRIIGQRPASLPAAGEEVPQVTIAVAKRKGTNAVWVAEEVISRVEELQGTVIADNVAVTLARDYGETANHKVNELVKHLLFAIATIIVLLAIALGPKESFIVAIAVPMTLAVTLLLGLILGYTINRVTLFALILSLGLLVDDPIVDVENIFRHFKLQREPPLEATLTAVDEVRPPTILATFTVIVSFLPLFFITGMMGPYMAPMALNVPVAMLMSLLVAFTVTPWATFHLLKGEYGKEEEPFEIGRSRVYRIYRAILGPLLASRARMLLFLAAIALAFLGSAALAVTRAVPLKMLPFDNKNELQLLIDTPEGTTLEETDALARDLGEYVATMAEVTDYQTFVGLASPMDFNGMVRHYYLRNGGNVGDIRISLLPKEERRQQSHAIGLRIRPDIDRIVANYPGAVVKVIEAPPGPPVLSTVVAEVYGPVEVEYDDLLAVARSVRGAFSKTEGVVDVDDYIEAPRPKVIFRIDREKAMLHGVPAAEIAGTLRTVLGGMAAGTVHAPAERLPLEILIRLPRKERSSARDLLSVRVRSASGSLVPLSELGTIVEATEDRTIYHKNLRRTAYVIGEMAGRSPVEAVFDLERHLAERPPPEGFIVDFAGEGEWKITLRVFRDLGMAFGAALLMIYVLLVAQTGSLSIPLVMMVAIPLTVIGIMPGFWLLNLLFTEPVGPYPDPIFFTATGMIGMIALAGIVVRNSIILIDFIERIRSGADARPLREAVIEAGATRFRPILLTAGAAMCGSFIITLDPIFSGLAWSFIFGIFASTAFSLLVIPVIYHLIYGGGRQSGGSGEGGEGAPTAAG